MSHPLLGMVIDLDSTKNVLMEIKDLFLETDLMAFRKS